MFFKKLFFLSYISLFTQFLFAQISEPPDYSDVLINEILADPTPSIGLPESEFIELYNRSKKYIDLSNWIIKDASRAVMIPHYIMAPSSYVILCDISDTSIFNSNSNIIGIGNFPSLNNNGDKLQLLSADSLLINQLNYDLSYYQDAHKENGGWTIELINPFKMCFDESNYSASISSMGGTPGNENSLFDSLPDFEPPKVLAYLFIADTLLEIQFNEILDSTMVELFKLDISKNQIENIELGMDLKSLLLLLEHPIDSGVFMSLLLSNIFDCEGNSIEELEMKMIVPAQANIGDVVINEILFNPHSGGSDYVEVLNLSEKILSLHGWKISNSDTSRKYLIDSPSQLFFPSEYWVLCEDINDIWSKFRTADLNRIIQTDLPSFNDKEGTAVIYNSSAKEMERFSYTEEMHYSLIDNVEGVSLERIDPFIKATEQNFFSASEDIGFGSPTVRNSQYSIGTNINSRFSLRHDIFSPDQDGNQDLLFIDYQFEKAGYAGSIDVLDAQGRLVKKLVNNQLFSVQGTIVWDGLDEKNRKPSIGIYLLLIEIFHPSGDRESIKLPFVLATKIN